MSNTYRPEMTKAGLEPTIAVSAVDEYQNIREMYIANERPLTIYVDSHEIVTLMTLGVHPELLTLGYLKNQGLIIDKTEEIKSVQVDWEVNAVTVTTFQNRDDWKDRLGPRIVTTGCGQGTVFDNIMNQLKDVKIKPIQLKQSLIYQLLKNINGHNNIYKNAGGVHGCALCQGSEIFIFIEDVGRHNAVDAIAGRMWLKGISGEDKLFYTTGRLTSEIVIKVAQMGISTLLSRSGITQMGLKLAQDLGVTILSRVQGKHFFIYHGEDNIEFDINLPAKLEVANLKKKVKVINE